MTNVFFYGSLRDRELTEIVLARPVPLERFVPARAEDHAALKLAHEAYPMLVPRPGAVAEGVVLMGAGPEEIARLSYFEEAEYGLEPITVKTSAGPFAAVYFRATDKPPKTDLAWDYAHWRAHERLVAVEAARELMHHYGALAVEDVDTIWPGIMIRARQRARALEAAEAVPAPRSPFGRADVEILGRLRAHTSYLAVQELVVRHRRFDGGWSESLGRSTVLWGDAVTVLPYDPARDRVLLIEQFRPGPAARGDASPWCLEVVAGRIDSAADAEATARREAREEAGLTLRRMEPIAGHYPTPGLAGEHLEGFIGEAELPGEGGLFGLAREHEDIRALVLGFDEAMAAVARGAVNTGPALVSLLWLAHRRDHLRAAWSLPG